MTAHQRKILYVVSAIKLILFTGCALAEFRYHNFAAATTLALWLFFITTVQLGRARASIKKLEENR